MILSVVKSVSLGVVVVDEVVKSFGLLLLLWEVNEEVFEGVEVQFAGWEFIKWVGILLYWGFFLWLGSGSWFLFLFLLGWGNSLVWLGAEFDVTESSDNLWESDESL